MKSQRLWIDITVFGAAAACALAILFSLPGTPEVRGEKRSPLVSSAQANTVLEHTYEGMVTCSRCGAKHSAALDRPASVCVRVCVHAGATFALVEPDAVYLLEGDLDGLKKVAGQRARVTGTLSGDTIRVASVIPL